MYRLTGWALIALGVILLGLADGPLSWGLGVLLGVGLLFAGVVILTDRRSKARPPARDRLVTASVEEWERLMVAAGWPPGQGRAGREAYRREAGYMPGELLTDVRPIDFDDPKWPLAWGTSAVEPPARRV